MGRLKPVAAGALAAALLACVGSAARLPAPAEGAVAVDPAHALAFHAEAEAFYTRLAQRRFNALETFGDPALRERFRSLDRFFDYYAGLAQALDEAHFEKSRPDRVEVVEFLFESPTAARIQLRFIGADDRPLRPGRARVVRVDRWERIDDRWWLTPGKL